MVRVRAYAFATLILAHFQTNHDCMKRHVNVQVFEPGFAKGATLDPKVPN